MSLTSHPRVDEEVARRQIVATMLAMSARGLNRGTAGNVSVRTLSGMLITPTGIEAERLVPEDIVPVSSRGD